MFTSTTRTRPWLPTLGLALVAFGTLLTFPATEANAEITVDCPQWMDCDNFELSDAACVDDICQTDPNATSECREGVGQEGQPTEGWNWCGQFNPGSNPPTTGCQSDCWCDGNGNCHGLKCSWDLVAGECTCVSDCED